MSTRVAFAAGIACFLVAAIAATGAFSVLGRSKHGARPNDRAVALPAGSTGGPGWSSLAWLALYGWPTPQPTPLPPPPDTPAPPVADAPPAADEPQPAPPEAPVLAGGLDTDFAAQVLAQVNAQRAAYGLASLSGDSALVAAAQVFASQLTQLGSLSHTATGVDLKARVRASGYGGQALGEALWFGRGGFSPSEVVAAWMGSPPHRALILDPKYQAAGAGCFFTGAGASNEGRCVLDLGG